MHVEAIFLAEATIYFTFHSQQQYTLDPTSITKKRKTIKKNLSFSISKRSILWGRAEEESSVARLFLGLRREVH